MKDVLVRWLWCPSCHSSLTLIARSTIAGEVMEGSLECDGCHATHRITSGVPRFIGTDGYSQSFSFQWQTWRSLQHFSLSGVPIYERRFKAATDLTETELAGKLVLDVGCGNGPYLDVVRRKGATVIGVDLSFAVDVAFQHYGSEPNVHLVQADIFQLPFRPMSFDVVFTLGVIQHTPSPGRAMNALPELVKPGGTLVIGAYRASGLYRLTPKYVFRLVTSRLGPERGMRFIAWYVPTATRVRSLCRILPGGRLLAKLMPLSLPAEKSALSEEQLQQWIYLDTFDMLITRYDRPQRPEAVRQVFEEACFHDVYQPTSTVNAFRGVRPQAGHPETLGVRKERSVASGGRG